MSRQKIDKKVNGPKGYNLHGDNQNSQLRNKKSKWKNCSINGLKLNLIHLQQLSKHIQKATYYYQLLQSCKIGIADFQQC